MKNDSKFIFGIVTGVLAFIILCLGFLALSPNNQFAQVFSSQRNSQLNNLTQQVTLLQAQVQEITVNQALSNLNETFPLLVSEFHEIFSSKEPNVPTTTPTTTPTDGIRYPTVEVTTDPVTKITTIKRCTAKDKCQIITIQPNGQIILSDPSLPFIFRLICDGSGNCVVKLNIPGEPTICTVEKFTSDDGTVYYGIRCEYDPIGPGNAFKKDFQIYINIDGKLCVVSLGPVQPGGTRSYTETCHDIDPKLIPYLVPMFPNLAPKPEKPVTVTPVGESPEVPKAKSPGATTVY